MKKLSDHGAFMIVLAIMFHGCMTSSCGVAKNDYIRDKTYKEKDPRDIKGIEPILQKHIVSWEKEFGSIGDIVVGFKNETTNTGAAGVCIEWTGQKRKYKQIEIRKSYYDAIMRNIAPKFPEEADKMVEQLIYHELAHCHLGQDHRDHMVDNKPGSIMRSFAFSSKEIQDYYMPEHEYYINELKTGGE